MPPHKQIIFGLIVAVARVAVPVLAPLEQTSAIDLPHLILVQNFHKIASYLDFILLAITQIRIDHFRFR